LEWTGVWFMQVMLTKISYIWTLAKDYKIGICGFSTKQAALWSKSKD
jgi:hypothetical protein